MTLLSPLVQVRQVRLGVEPGLVKELEAGSASQPHRALCAPDSGLGFRLHVPACSTGSQCSLPGQHALNARRDLGKQRQAAWCGGRG